MGIYILFEKENIDTGKMEGELLLSILSSLAESESHSISENEIWSIQKRFRNGTFKISYPPYGYDYIDGEMVVNSEQSEIVKWIFTEVLRSIFSTQPCYDSAGYPILCRYCCMDKRWLQGDGWFDGYSRSRVQIGFD